MSLLRNLSLRERLHFALVGILVLVFITFILFGFYLSWNEWLNATVLVQVVSSCMASMVLFATLGLRMISDALEKYEKSTIPRIKGLQGLIRQSQGHILQNNPIQILEDTEKILKATSYMIKFQNFFFTKLYPTESIKKLNSLTTTINELATSLQELFEEWPVQENQFQYIQALLTEDENERQQLIKSYLRSHQTGAFNINEFISRVLTENRGLIDRIRKFKKNTHQELDEIEEELDNFLQLN